MSCDCEHPTLYNSKVVKGRKEYKCCECSTTIVKSQSHEYVWGLWEGRSGTYRTCLDCVALRNRANIEIDDFCFAHSELVHELDACDCLHETDDNAIGSYCSLDTLVDWIVRINGNYRVS